MLTVLVSVGITSCVDDDLVFRQGVMPHGEAVINIEAAFVPFSESTVGSRAYDAPKGDVMGDVSDVVLLAYEINGNILDGFPMELTDYTEADEARDPSAASNGATAEIMTKCLKKTVKLFYGEYYLVAVANMGEYAKDSDGKITVTKSTKQVLDAMDAEKYSTLDRLRMLRRAWDSTNYANNRAMCGYFTDKSKDTHSPGATDDFLTVVVDSDTKTLRAWMRRIASKVTVDFDGTDLRENVKIYIKDVKIYDLASSCTLGFGKRRLDAQEHYKNYNNTVGSDDDAASGDKAAMLHDGPHEIKFYNMYNSAASADDASHKDWPVIAKGSPYIYVDPAAAEKEKRDLHANNAQSLFFYENMQGDAPNGKGPILDLINGGVANKDVVKESVPYGTYIEVTGFYESEASGNVSNGPIKYRFMLGKDAVKNCDAERNYHYKVTLKFNGNANDYSWHIDYREEPDSWDVPQPWYVSYLYNHQSNIPFKYTPKDGYEVVYFDAEIIKNPWEPDEDPGIPLPPDNEDAIKADENKKLGNGFLSLRQTLATVITPQDCGQASWPGYDTDNNANVSINLNDKYFLGESDNSGGLDRSKRRYNVSSDAAYNDSKDDLSARPNEEYSYQRKGQSVSLSMPLFTRAKTLIKQSAYSGNNPYVGYTRTAKIKVTPYVRKIDSDDTPEAATPKEMEVEQVRRIVNPKGVYRRSGNNQDFNVHLLELPGDMANSFRDFKSDGPWMAEILGDKNFITLDGKQVVTGSTGSSIEFTIRFNKLNIDPDDKNVRNAVVRVLYNSYTCTHLIFVRQGYEPQAISEKATDFNHQGNTATPVKWRTFNRISARVDAKDPRDEGSMFKYGQIWTVIDSYNNCYGDVAADGKRDGRGNYTIPIGLFTSDNASNGSYRTVLGDGTLATTDTKWTDIKSQPQFTTDYGWDKMATMRHFEQLYTTPNMNFGFGVLYADGATSTQYAVNDAYGYYRRDPENTGPKGPDPNYGTDSRKGMRGLFVYYWDASEPDNLYTGKNIFFPIGRSGFGHRKHGQNINKEGKIAKTESDAGIGKGILRYSCSGYQNRGNIFNKTAPLFAAVYYRPGAIYYARDRYTDGNYLDWTGSPAKDGTAIGMDINYFSFDVNMISEYNLGAVDAATYSEPADACFVRFIADD